MDLFVQVENLANGDLALIIQPPEDTSGHHPLQEGVRTKALGTTLPNYNKTIKRLLPAVLYSKEGKPLLSREELA